jgi:CubicO group peptidase (beta-lactamase class C family)
VLGLFGTTSSYQEGYGCRIAYPGSVPLEPVEAPVQIVLETPAYETPNADLRAALDRAFSETPGETPRQMRAIVVVRNGRIVGERYADGYGPNTPLPSYSVAKSVTNALLGILVRQGRLRVDMPAPVAAWRTPRDPRGAITIDHLLRMDSGLGLGETGSGFDPVSRMLYLERDMAGYAQTGPASEAPARAWDYTSANTLVLCRILGDMIGGGAAGYRAFARSQLFEPLGMDNVTLQFDGAGTQVGSTEILAPARDWARFGQLFLNDGVAPDGTRLLPEGWVAASRRSTLGSTYGAGFWTNDGGSEFAALRIKAGMPADGFFASGNRGQRIYIMPSAHLVIVRLGMTHRPPDFDIAGDLHLIRDVIAALSTGDAMREEGIALQVRAAR